MALFDLFRNKKKEETEEVKTAEVSSEISPEIIAVISAAVACMLGAGATIVGIRKSSRNGSGKTAWRNAGLLDNTRSF